MAKRLASTVHGLVDPRSGAVRSFGPGDDVPMWAAEKITNPAAWADDDARESVLAGPDEGDLTDAYLAGREAGRAEKLTELCEAAGVDGEDALLEALSATGEAATGDSGSGAEPLERPSGNASQEEWAAYAVSQGADPAEVADVSRNDLRDHYSGD